MRLDFLEVIGGAFETIIGRFAATALTIHLATGLGALFEERGGNSFEGIFGFFLIGLPYIFVSIFSPPGMVVVPLLFGFSILFTRYEWPWKSLTIPAILSFVAGWEVSSWY